MVGRTISHYRITGQLGSGGMGVVYSGEDVRLGRSVALKFVSHDLADDEQAVQRLRSEARAASALNHPHICTIYDIGEDDGRPFIVMELMRGQTLRERLANSRLSPQQVLDVGIEVADALHVAHTSGIVHRDIKPGNIFLTEAGHVKVLDFGLAKISPLEMGAVTTAQHSPAATAAGIMLGTTAYMSPEQVAGEQLDGRSDLFSLGVVLYEAASGEHPFPGKTAAAVVAAILDRAPAPALAHMLDVPQRLQEVIENCLEKDRELRYQSAADLRADLKRVRRDLESSHARNSAMSAGASSARSSSLRSSRSRPYPQDEQEPAQDQAETRGRAARNLAIAAALVGLVVLAAVFAAYRFGASSSVGDTARQVEPASPPPVVAPNAIDERLRLAQASFDARNYRGAVEQATEVLRIDRDHQAALQLRDKAQQMVIAFDKAIAEVNQRMAVGDVEGAARALESARAIDPVDPTVVALSSRLGEVARRRASLPPERVDPRRDARASAGGNAVAAVPPQSLPSPPAQPAAPTPTPPVPAAPAPMPSAPVPQSKPPAPQEITPAAKPPVEVASEPPKPEPPKVDKAPPAAEPPARPAPQANDDGAIRQLVAGYARAIETKDLGLFRTIKPNLSREEERRLQEGFRAVTSQRVNLTIVSIERSGDHAVVVINRKDTVRAGGREYTSDSRQTLQMARSGTAWGITDIR